MKQTTLAAVVLAALTVTAGAAVAAPGNAPDGIAADHADAHANDTADAADGADEADGASDRGANESADVASGQGTDRSADAGPPEDVPGNVPSHVQAIHDLIREHLSRMLDGALGPAVSDATPEGGEGQPDDGTAVNGTASTPTPEPTEAA